MEFSRSTTVTTTTNIILYLKVDVSEVFIEIIFSVGGVVTETADNVLLFVQLDGFHTGWH